MRSDFDVALSFAGEDRALARELASELSKFGARVFFDEYFPQEFLGKDLYAYLHETYSRRARYCVALISRAYVEKVWTRHEIRSAQERALKQGYVEYLLPVRIDKSKVPGLMSTIGYVDAHIGPETIAHILIAKLWPTSKIVQQLPNQVPFRKIRIGEWQTLYSV
jgi:hypothetical protein